MKKMLVVLISIIFVPFIITNFFYEYKIKKIISGFNTNKEKQIIRVLKQDQSIINLDLEEYLIGVVSAEVPMYFEDEALKAQAVAARTYALKQIENHKNESYDVKDDTSSQVYQTDEQLKKKWNENYDKYINRVKEIIDSTSGEYITYNDEIIYAFFFSTSNGKTEDNKDVFGADLPYLKVVDSSFDENETSNFLYTKTISTKEFYQNLGINYSDELNISNIEKTASGRISSIEINGNKFKGRTFQSKLALRSNDFSIEKEENNIKITTKGYGHGVGMSQYGANALAKQNKKYDEILKYYYKGTNLKKL